MRVTLEKLRYFVVLAEELSFTRAAARVHLSQQAFSLHIKQLEAWVGAPLFQRGTRSVMLSPAGRELVKPVREALALWDKGVNDARALGGVGGRLRIGGLLGSAGELSGAAIRLFCAEHPDVIVEIRETQWHDPTGGLRDGHVEVAFVRPPLDTTGLVIRQLFTEPIVLAVSSKHPLASASEVTLAQALAEPLVLARSAPHEWNDFWLLCEERGGLPQCTATADTLVEEIETVAAGLASSFLPASVARVFLHYAAVRFLPIVGGPLSPVALAWRDKGLTATARAFVDLVSRVVDCEAEMIAALEAGREPARRRGEGDSE